MICYRHRCEDESEFWLGWLKYAPRRWGRPDAACPGHAVLSRPWATLTRITT